MHWRYYVETDPSPEFVHLVQSLETISSRWEGCLESEATPRLNFARKCANHLIFLRNKCTDDERFRVDVLGYINEVGSSAFGLQTNEQFPGDEQVAKGLGVTEHGDLGNQDCIQSSKHDMGRKNNRPILAPIGLRRPSTAYNQLPGSISSLETALDYPSTNDGAGTLLGHNEVPLMTENLFVADDLDSISQMFIDQHFLEMDRVITYDDGVFAPNMEWWDQDNEGAGI